MMYVLVNIVNIVHYYDTKEKSICYFRLTAIYVDMDAI